MRVKGKFNGLVVGFVIKYDKANDGREAHVDIDISLKQDEAAKKFGDDFALMAFATMRVIQAEKDDETNAVAFLVDNVKPGHRVIWEMHRIAIDGQEISAQPILRGIATVDGEARVVAQLRIPIDIGKQVIITALTKRVGQTVKVEFEPNQAGFDFDEAKTNGAGKGRLRAVKDETAEAPV